MRVIEGIIGASFIYLVHAQSVSAESWSYSEPERSSACASTSTDLSAVAGPGTIGLLNICYAKNMGCRPEIGVALLRGNGYGRVLNRFVESQKMQVMGDGRLIAEGPPTRTNYDNGYEVSLMTSQSDAVAVGSSRVIRIRVVSEGKLFEFTNSVGAKTIGLARSNCR